MWYSHESPVWSSSTTKAQIEEANAQDKADAEAMD